jgi:hypothetical protein
MKSGLSLTSNRWSEFEQEEEASDESELGITPRPKDRLFASPASTTHGEHGVWSGNGLGSGKWDAGDGV